MIKDTKLNYALNVAARWVVGLVFLFSSFVKGVDPMGTMFKVQDYMSNWELFGMSFTWAHPLAGVLAVALICAEFLVGVMLIFNSFRVFSAWLLTLMMAFFTVTTFVDATTNLVDDCGCFGDAIKLTNWQTFWKNIALDVPTVWILLTCRLRMKRRFERDIIVVIAGLVAMLVFSIYNINHEPVIDFRPWKIGNKMIEEREAMNHMLMQNKETGDTVTIHYRNGEWESVPAEYRDFDKWDVLQSTSDEPAEILAPGFSMMDLEGADHALELISAEEGLVIVTIHHLNKIDAQDADEVKTAVTLARENEKQVVLLTSALPEDIQVWLFENQLDDMEFYFADATAIETMMRGNPGFMYVENAVVVDKGREASKLKIEN